MGTNINEDGTKGFVNTAIRGGDLGLIAAWHGADDPTAANNKIPANGLFLNTTAHVIKLNIGTEAAPIWKSLLQVPVFGRSSIDETINANTTLDGSVHEYGNLTINDGITLEGTSRQNLALIVNDTLTINGTISKVFNGGGIALNSKNLDVHGGASADGTAGGIADVYHAPNINDTPIYHAARGSENGTQGGGGIIILARKIIFGANGKIDADGADGNNGRGSAAGGIIFIVSTTPLTADQKAKIEYADYAPARNGADGIAGQTVAGGKARLVELVV